MTSFIDASETEIVGAWIRVRDQVQNDENEKRIQWLIANLLNKVATDWSGWELLYRNPQDGRYWELTHPHGELQAGGPCALRFLSDEAAAQKYRVDAAKPIKGSDA